MDTLLTQKDVALRWRMSARTLEAWRWKNRGPRFIKFGKSVRYRIEDIKAYERAQLRRIDGRLQICCDAPVRDAPPPVRAN